MGKISVPAREQIRKDNFRYLFVALIIFFAVLPIGSSLYVIPEGVTWLIAVCILLITGVLSLRDAGWRFHLGIGLVVTGVAASTFETAAESDAAHLISLLTLMGFLVLAINNALRQVVYGVEMNANRLYGAVCIYLMIGLLWALLYYGLNVVAPGSFGGGLAATPEDAQIEWIYYSFVTLTTLGYGDILPLSAPARALAYSEAIVGVFYMAILVAALVSGYLAEIGRNKDA